MGQHSSRPAQAPVIAQEGQPTAQGASRRLRALSWTSRSSPLTRNRSARTAPDAARRRSLFGGLFKDRRNSVHNESPVIPTSASAANATPVQDIQEPRAPPAPDVRPPDNPHRNHGETGTTRPGTLMIVHGTMPADDGLPRAPSMDHSSSQLSANTSAAELGSQDTLGSSQNSPASQASAPAQAPAGTSDERLQTSIDVLAALLSMATAATATSLLTGTTDVLSTLSSESPAGPQVSPTRARAAWDTLESLFYLRSTRRETLSPHVELFRDLALAVLTSRSSHVPRMTAEARAGRPQLPSGTFERFLIDLNANVRTSLREDYVRRGPDTGEAPRRLNWWRAYQFPSVQVAHASPLGGNNRAENPNSTSQRQGPRFASSLFDEEASQPRYNPAHTTTENLIPVVIVGLRSLSRDSNNRSPFGSPSPSPSAENTTSPSASVPGSPAGVDSPVRPTSADEIDAITSSYVIIVLGGHYPPEHRYASATGSDDSNELDQLWDLVELVPFKPTTATAEEISKSGLTCFKASEISKMKVAENTAEKCLICLEDYADDAELRLLGCTHAFHKSMLPGWQTEELAEEWIENNDEIASGSYKQDQYLQNVKKHAQISPATSLASSDVVGTVLVKLNAGQAGRLPLAGRLGLVNKNMFSPLKLETMFQPPTPRLSPNDQAVASDTQNAPFKFNDEKSSQSYQFTFNRPHLPPVPPDTTQDSNPDATKLRLFQFQYDTYTRDHLSALIDSIPFDSSSRTNSTPSLRKRDTDDISHAFRPHKRIKISSQDQEEVGPAKARRRPRLSLPMPATAKKDHFVESRSLNQGARATRTASNTTSNALRSNASSTINASESARSYSTEELASKMRQVALVSAESDREDTHRASAPVNTQSRSQGAGAPKGVSPALLANHAKLHDRLSRILDEKAAAQDRKPHRFPSAATNITTIAPTDISPVPEQIGNMRFDKSALRWVKRAGEESDDPFRDIESVGGSKSNEQRPEGLSISFEESAQRVIDALTGELDYASNLSSDDEPQRDEEAETGTVQFNPGGILSVPPPESFSTPVGARLRPQSRSAAPTPIRSAMKATTPVIMVHGPEPGSSTGKLRSVSFSDGRRSGRIRGLHQSADDGDTSNSQDAHPQPQFEEKRSLQPSFRTKRIADLLDDLDGETSRDDEEDHTPCKSSSQQRSMVGSLLGASASGAGSTPSFGLSVASRPAVGRSTRGRDRDATFLTECSFGVAHDRLLQCLTDVQPFEPHWEEQRSIDLSGKGIDSLARLKEFMPELEELIINENAVSWLSGIPGGVRLLSAVSNQLTGLTSYAHLVQLESLDISRNQIDSLLQLECLHRLRELKADYNQIGSLAGLHKLGRLRKLSVIGNQLTHADLSKTDWRELDHLDLSKNKLASVEGLDSLEKVAFVNLEDNMIRRLDIVKTMSRLRCLRVSDNRLEESLDVRGLGGVRILYADRNRLSGIIHGEKLKRLETLSMRYQSGKGLVINARDVRDVRRLYLSGNSLGSWFLDEPCYNLIYLEMADCQLMQIPKEIGRVIPNVRVLNLNHNFIRELDGLGELRRLRKLSIIGSRLRNSREIVKAVRRMGELEMVDFRMNPFSVSWYVPLLDGGDGEWQSLDAKFRRGLPDDLYAGRLVYRGLLIRSCGRLKTVDGLKVSDGERLKAGELLGRIENQKTTPQERRV